MEGEAKLFCEGVRCYADGTIERKREQWKDWRKVDGLVLFINKQNIARHRIISKCFMEVPEDDKYQVRHKDGNHHNCNINNLSIVIGNERISHNWEGIKSYKIEGKKRYKVMVNGVFGGDFINLTYAKFSEDNLLGKKWIWRIITEESRPNRNHYLERGRAETQKEAETIGEYELYKWKNNFTDPINKQMWKLDIYEDN